MTATIATLIDAKWKPIDPAAWITPATSGGSSSNAGNSEQLASFMEMEGQSAKEILHRLEEDLEAKLWQEASTTRKGAGLEKGTPHFGPAAKAHADFVKKGEHKIAKAVELIVCNKVWTKQRLLEAELITEEDALCDRCGECIETDLHRYYECQANRCIDSDDVAKTQYLTKEARREPHNACKWFRAILPGSIIS
jgi:hypothetical protein